MYRLSGSTRSTAVQCITVLPRSLCRNLIAPIPTAINRRALNSLNMPMRTRTNDDDDDDLEDSLDRCPSADLRQAVCRATIPWYLLVQCLATERTTYTAIDAFQSAAYGARM